MHARDFCVQIALASVVCLGLTSTAFAGAVNYSLIAIDSPVFASGTGSAIVSPTLTGGYTFSAEFCENDSCSTGPVFTTASSLLRLTNLTLTCDSGSECAPIDVTFEADAFSAPIGAINVGVQLTGSGNASGYGRVCFADENNICSSSFFGNESFTFPYVNNISGLAQGTISSNGSFSVLGDFHVDGVQGGASVNLFNSLDISLTSAVPEPSTTLLSGLGLALLLFAFVSRQRKAHQ